MLTQEDVAAFFNMTTKMSMQRASETDPFNLFRHLQWGQVPKKSEFDEGRQEV